MKQFSHRARGFGEENTLSAFKKVLKSHVEAIEIDVRVTKDNKFVVKHDGIHKRRFIWNQIQKESQLPLLKDFLKEFKKNGNGKTLQLDLKDTYAEKEFFILLKKYNIKDFVIYSSNVHVLQKVHKLNKKIPLILTYMPISSLWGEIKFQFSTRINIVVNKTKLITPNQISSMFSFYSSPPELPVVGYCIPANKINSKLIAKAKKLNKYIVAFKVTKKNIQKLKELGINHFLLDDARLK